jgi:hypothetical protein
MKRHAVSILALFLVIGTVRAQGAAEGEMFTLAANSSQDTESPVPRMDETVKILAGDIHGRLVAEKAEKIAVGLFSHQGASVPLGAYWINQLSGELVNISGRPYIVLSGGAAGADWTISGEIVALPGVIRIYTRLVRSGDRAIEAAFQSDFERSADLAAMLASAASSPPQGSQDEWEPDSWEHPLAYEIGGDENAPATNRSIHAGDEDFFLLVPERDGRLVAETTGSIDTYMHLYNYETQEGLAENDDGGSGNNARIRYNVQAGARYLAKVRGYSSNVSGPYAFRAYIITREGASSWQNPISCEIGIGEETQTLSRTLASGDDEEYFLLAPDTGGLLVMETTGSVDTYMELYNEQTREKLGENDDGGSGNNARIRHSVNPQERYIVLVRGYDSSATGTYGFKAYFTGQGTLDADQYEPDDESSQAGQVEIGTAQEHTFHHTDDVDWVKFEVTQSGRYIIRARGTRSSRLDTYIELFDANLNSIAEDDDGGNHRDALLSLQLQNGMYYLKVWCLDEDPDQSYTIRVFPDD